MLLSVLQVFGSISPPPGVSNYDNAAGGEIGIVAFFSTLLQIGTLIAGIYVLIQLIIAGWEYITADGANGANKVKDRFTYSIIGLVIIVTSYAIAALIGFILFGDATFIINPRLDSIVP